jgi:hypothetical protein
MARIMDASLVTVDTIVLYAILCGNDFFNKVSIFSLIPVAAMIAFMNSPNGRLYDIDDVTHPDAGINAFMGLILSMFEYAISIKTNNRYDSDLMHVEDEFKLSEYLLSSRAVRISNDLVSSNLKYTLPSYAAIKDAHAILIWNHRYWMGLETRNDDIKNISDFNKHSKPYQRFGTIGKTGDPQRLSCITTKQETMHSVYIPLCVKDTNDDVDNDIDNDYGFYCSDDDDDDDDNDIVNVDDGGFNFNVRGSRTR